jgi:predicted CXXCH cytochrome family protein
MSTSHVTPRMAASVVGGVFAVSVWLLGTAMPVAADGGPHISGVNSGFSSLTSDGCAGCHRAHTAQGPMLLIAQNEMDLCLVCHGATGQGATTDVEGGVQYSSTADHQRLAPVVGALRSGGFVDARIDSAHSSRKSYPAYMPDLVTTFSSRVGVLAAGQPVTSAHLDLHASGTVATQGVAWGNSDGTFSATPYAGPVVELGCSSCHNPHGNGQYRILNTIPSPDGAGFVAAAGPVEVLDNALPSGSGAVGVRNYTIQNGRTLADVIAAGLGPTAGDYWRRWIPWDLVPTWNAGINDIDPAPLGSHSGDVPMYVPDDPDNLEGYRSEIRTWCLACHTRYGANNAAATNPSGDAIFAYRHTNSRVTCTQCHVAHGSNAAMPGEGGTTFSNTFPYPNGVASPSSRLLKINNRGTCQACHDPTHTIPFDGAVISH